MNKENLKDKLKQGIKNKLQQKEHDDYGFDDLRDDIKESIIWAEQNNDFHSFETIEDLFNDLES